MLLIGTPTVSYSDLGQLSALVPTIIVISLIGILIMLFVIGGTVFGTVQAILGEHVSVVLALRQTKRRFLPCLGYGLLYMLVVGLLTLTIVGSCLLFWRALGFWQFGSFSGLFSKRIWLVWVPVRLETAPTGVVEQFLLPVS